MTAAPKRGTMRDRAIRSDGGWAPSQEPLPGLTPQPAPSQRKQPYDPAKAPAGYDQDYWGMAVLFRDLAMKDVNLRVGPPVIYGELRRIFDWFELETGGRAYQKRGDGTVEKTFGQMYRDGKGKTQTWVQVGYAIIEEFWSRTWDDDALSDFCDKEILTLMAIHAVDHWKHERYIAWRKEQDAASPEPMEWNRDGHRKRRRNTSE